MSITIIPVPLLSSLLSLSPFISKPDVHAYARSRKARARKEEEEKRILKSAAATVSTGSRALDSILGGGIREGMLTDIYGESGSGKSQLCFSLCANCAKSGGRAVFIDTAGTFRPERVLEIAGADNGVLDRITFFRALTALDQEKAVNRIVEIDPQVVVIDTLTSLFSAEYSGPARHLAVMSHLHDLALLAVSGGYAVVVTNMVRNAPATAGGGRLGGDAAVAAAVAAAASSQQREYLGSSVSIYSHMKIKTEIIDPARSVFQATLVHPPTGRSARFAITARGVSDLGE